MMPFLRKYFGKLIAPLLWTILIAVACCLPGKMLPSETGFRIPEFDKLVHAGMFGGFIFLWALYTSNKITDNRVLLRWFFLFFVLSNAYGIGMEFIQKCCVPLRDYDEADIIADMVGAGIGYGLSNLLLLPQLVKKV